MKRKMKLGTITAVVIVGLMVASAFMSIATRTTISSSLSEKKQIADTATHPQLSLSMKCGDVNYDHSVNVNDVVYLINYLFVPGSPEPVPMRCVGDANGDGVTNVNDVVYLINYLFVPGSPGPLSCCSG